MNKIITDVRGNRTTIEDGQIYTVIYSTIARPHDRFVLTNLRTIYGVDNPFISRLDGEGNVVPATKIYYDNNVPDPVGPTTRLIHAVYTEAQWQDLLADITLGR